MQIAMIGLGKMGGNMVRRMRAGGLDVIGFDYDQAAVQALAQETGMHAASSLEDMISQFSGLRVVWVMVPSGTPTEQTIQTLAPMLNKNDIVIDGGNSNYHDSERHFVWLQDQGIRFCDVGTSGGVWGLDNGYCMMAGGTADTIEAIKPALEVLAPAPDQGWAHVGPAGSGHFVKMVHNGIEYGMMQAYAEGLALLRGKQAFELDLAQITELWRHSSVVRSWLLDLTADALQEDQALTHIAPVVPDSGEGRWTAIEGIEQGVATPVMTLAVQMRFTSQDKEGYANRLLSLMRNAFGGHTMAKGDSTSS